MGRKPVITAGFSFYARNASQVIDQYTFGRLEKLEEIPEEVRLCCCELAESEYLYEQKKKESAGKTSEKIGTYSVSFESGEGTSRTAAGERRNAVLKWLAATGLCYQGVE